MVGFYGSPGPVMRQKSKGTRPLRNKMRALARRRGYAGFPIAARPFTADEVDAYFSADSITCLLCGRGFRRLASHLPAIHQVTEDDYRAMYGLPWGRGLTCQETKSLYGAAAKARIAAGEMPHIGQGVPPGKYAYRPRQPFHKEKAARIGRLVQSVPIYGDDDFRAVMGRILAGEKFPMENAPGASWFRRWKRLRPHLNAELMAKIDALPFCRQAALGFGMGERFTEAVAFERKTGASDRQIAARLGVSTMTVFHRRRRAGIL